MNDEPVSMTLLIAATVIVLLLAMGPLWLLSIGIAFDRMVNALLLGSCDETLSSRAYRAWRDGKWPGTWLKVLIDAIFRLFRQIDHCKHAFTYEEERFKQDVITDTAGRALADTLRKH